MFFTTTALRRTLEKFLPDEEFSAVFWGVHNKAGKVIVVFTVSGRFIVFKSSLFGQIKHMFEYDIELIRNFDVFVLKNLQFHFYWLSFEYQELPVLIKVSVSAFGNLDKEMELLHSKIYELSAEAMPYYMKDLEFLHQIGTSLGNMKIFDKKIIIFKPRKGRFVLDKELDLQNLVDFDAYAIDYKVIVYFKFENEELTFYAEDFAPDNKRLNSHLGVLMRIFNKSVAAGVKPGFLSDDELYIYDCPVFITPTISNKALRTYFVLTDKGFLILAKKKSPRRELVRKIGFEQMAYLEPFEQKRYANIDKGFKLILKNGKKLKFHQLNIRQYDSILTEINRMLFRD